MFMKTSSQCGHLNSDTDIRNARIFVGTWPAYKMENVLIWSSLCLKWYKITAVSA